MKAVPPEISCSTVAPCRLAKRANKHELYMQHIPPGRPMKNGFIARFNRIHREEVLKYCIFESSYECAASAQRSLLVFCAPSAPRASTFK